MNELITSGIPYSWMLSELTLLFKAKGSILYRIVVLTIQECSNYRGIKLKSYTLMLCC